MEMVLGAGGKKTWIGRFIFIALLRFHGKTLLGACLMLLVWPPPRSLSVFPLIDKSNKL